MVFQLTEEEQTVLASVMRSRTGTVLLGMLKRKQAMNFEVWLNKLDESAGAHLRGKASELRDLIKILETLSQSKE